MKLIVILTALNLCFICLAAGCPNLWYEYNGSCYRLFDEERNFLEARSLCQSQRADLTVISNHEENLFVTELFYLQEDVNGSSISRAYIGLTDIDVEGVFVWIDGSPLTYTNWSSGEPNNYFDEEDITVMSGPASIEYGLWNDFPDYLEAPVICERRARVNKALTTNVFQRSMKAVFLDRLMLTMINVRSEMECLLRCLQYPDCVSVNFWQGGQLYNSICVLNAATRDEYNAAMGQPGDSYYGVDVAEWVYVEMFF